MHRTGIHKPILGFLVVFVMAFINYQVGENETHDQITSFMIAFSFLYTALVILILTEVWYWRAVGVMVALGGTGLVYALIFGRGAEILNVSQEVTRAILRAALDFGGPVLAICVTGYLIDRFFHDQKEDFLSWLDLRRHYRNTDGNSG